MNRLLILSYDAPAYADLISAANLPQLEIAVAESIEAAAAEIPGCNIILGNPNWIGAVLDAAEKLEWVQSGWAGVNSLCAPGLRRDYILSGVKDVFGPQISEYVLTYLFALERQLFSMRDNQLQRCWQPIPYRAARDIRLGVVGLGSIGRYLARVARQFGIRVSGLNSSGRPCHEVEKVFTLEGMNEFLGQLDYLVVTLPDTPLTKHFINADVLAMMKPSAVLINVGRGSTVNEADLVRALKEGIIGGAVLDVFETEPLAQDSPLWTLPNVFLTPHQAALSFPADITGIFIENYHRFLNGETLLHVVDFETGY